MKKINITFARYALADIIYSLHCSGIDNITITREDNDLEIVIDSDELANVVLPRNGANTKNCEPCKEWGKGEKKGD